MRAIPNLRFKAALSQLAQAGDLSNGKPAIVLSCEMECGRGSDSSVTLHMIRDVRRIILIPSCPFCLMAYQARDRNSQRQGWPPRSDHFNWLAKEKPNCLKGSVYPKIGEKDEDGGTNRKIAI